MHIDCSMQMGSLRSEFCLPGAGFISSLLHQARKASGTHPLKAQRTFSAPFPHGRVEHKARTILDQLCIPSGTTRQTSHRQPHLSLARHRAEQASVRVVAGLDHRTVGQPVGAVSRRHCGCSSSF